MFVCSHRVLDSPRFDVIDDVADIAAVLDDVAVPYIVLDGVEVPCTDVLGDTEPSRASSFGSVNTAVQANGSENESVGEGGSVANENGSVALVNENGSVTLVNESGYTRPRHGSATCWIGLAN